MLGKTSFTAPVTPVLSTIGPAGKMVVLNTRATEPLAVTQGAVVQVIVMLVVPAGWLPVATTVPLPAVIPQPAVAQATVSPGNIVLPVAVIAGTPMVVSPEVRVAVMVAVAVVPIVIPGPILVKELTAKTPPAAIPAHWLAAGAQVTPVSTEVMAVIVLPETVDPIWTAAEGTGAEDECVRPIDNAAAGYGLRGGRGGVSGTR